MFTVGQIVSLVVEFYNGRKLDKVGRFICVDEENERAYIECDDGCYDGDASTLEAVE